jgi:hypothetical protein
MPSAPLLVNLTGKPVFVVTHGLLLQLPEAPEPRVLELSNEPRTTFFVDAGGVEVELSKVAMTGSLVSAPPVEDEVLWLVRSEVLAQFPNRADFIRPAAYQLFELDLLDCSQVDADVLKSAEVSEGMVFALVQVSSSTYVAAAHAQRLQDLDEF